MMILSQYHILKLDTINIYSVYMINTRGGGWSLVDLRNVGSYFLNGDGLKYNFHSQFDYFCIHIFDNSQLSRI